MKARLDALAVAGVTFRYGAAGPEGLLGGRRVIVASARGGFDGADTPMASYDHHETRLSDFLGFPGITDVTVIRAEGVLVRPEVREPALRAALEQAALLEAA